MGNVVPNREGNATSSCDAELVCAWTTVFVMFILNVHGFEEYVYPCIRGCIIMAVVLPRALHSKHVRSNFVPAFFLRVLTARGMQHHNMGIPRRAAQATLSTDTVTSFSLCTLLSYLLVGLSERCCLSILTLSLCLPFYMFAL